MPPVLLDAPHPPSGPHGRRAAAVFFACLIALTGWLMAATGVQAAPAAQGTPGASPQLYLLPQDAAASDVVLETHVAVLRIVPTDAGPQMVMDATYILRNPTDATVTVPLRLLFGGDRSLGPLQAVSLTADGAALALTPDADGGFTGTVELGAEDRLPLALTYQANLGVGPLASVRYVPAVLNSWAGNISLRIELILPDTIPAESWIQVTPTTWRYSVVTEPDVTGLRWLYDFSAPDEPFRFQFVAPRAWAEIVAAEAAATGNAPVANFVQLGALYQRLARAAADPAVRDRYHAQAVAAYQAGLTTAGWGLASPQEKAAVHLGLADLYRSQIVTADAAARLAYAQLLVDATDQTLALLPADDARRSEALLWQADGLRLLLDQALTRRDWPVALVYLDRLTSLPPELVDPAQVTAERDAILVQQALELMEEGNREAALAVAGDLIAADALVPPAEAAGLFVGWQITVTAAPGDLQMVIVGLTTPERAETAADAFSQVVAAWQAAVADAGDRQTQIALDTTGVAAPVDPSVRVTVDFPPAANGFLLARRLPPRPDYALLRSLLSQLAPAVERQHSLFWQEVVQRQPLDLAPAVAEWTTIAAGLEQQAQGFDAQSGSRAAGDSTTAQAALAASIQAVNYRTAAADWRRLARQSWLQFTFRLDDPLFTPFRDAPPSRTWTITAGSPSQTLAFQTQMLDLTRLTAASAAMLAGLAALAAALWGLL